MLIVQKLLFVLLGCVGAGGVVGAGGGGGGAVCWAVC